MCEDDDSPVVLHGVEMWILPLLVWNIKQQNFLRHQDRCSSSAIGLLFFFSVPRTLFM